MKTRIDQFGRNPVADVELFRRVRRGHKDRSDRKQEDHALSMAVVIACVIIFAVVGLVEFLWS